LPPALTSSCSVTLTCRRGNSGGLNRIGSRTKIVRGDVRDDTGLARSVGGMSWRPTQVSRRGHRTAGRRAALHHLDLTAHPSAGMFDCLTRSRVLRLRRFEVIKNVLSARCRPEGQKVVIRIGQSAAAADRDVARISDLREDHAGTIITRTVPHRWPARS